MLPDWQSWAEWESFLALYSQEGIMNELQDWWPPVRSFAESPLVGSDALTSLPVEAVFTVRSTDDAEKHSVRVPPPPPPPLRVSLNLADAIEVKAPDYEPVVHTCKKEMVGDTPVVESQSLNNIERAGNDDEVRVTDSEQDAPLAGTKQGPAMELDPRLGTEELPTRGSAGHWEGLCKPCAFMTRGCSLGVECSFCHLCGPDERKKRRKEKIAYMRELRRTGSLRKSS
jgi:hypothetical protein